MLVTNINDMNKRQRTRTSLRETALYLFAEQGYDRTTTAQIARQADVSEMTLFRHFASKEALLLEDPFDPMMADEVYSRPASEKPLRAVSEGIRQAWSTLTTSELTDLRWLLKVISGTPSLQGALERNSGLTASALADALERRGVAAHEARVAAASVIAGLSRTLLDWADDQESDLNERMNRTLDLLGSH